MKEYPDQPRKEPPDLNEITKIIEDELGDSLPECEINEWFIDSVHFANMIDKIARELAVGE